MTLAADALIHAMSNIQWKDQRFAYSGNNLVYIGFHTSHNAATSDSGWYVWKQTYSGGNLTRRELLIGPWDDRATLGWG